GSISSTGLSNEAIYHGAKSTSDISATGLDNIGFVFPFPTVQGSLVFAFGFNRVSDFASAMKYEGFNDQSSIIQTFFSEGTSEYNVPYRTFLTDLTGENTTVLKNINQRGEVKEGGSLGQWSFSGAVDIEENISLGVSLNVFSGTYDYSRNFVEEDTRNLYNNTAANLPSNSAYLRFNKFYLDNFLSSELSGSNITLGLMYRAEVVRLGLVAKGPTSIKVQETYSDDGQSVFDANGGTWSPSNPAKKYSTPASTNEYSVSSPWTFGAGASFYILPEFLLAADVEYTDWTQIEWADNPGLEKRNAQLQTEFRSVVGYRLGAEFDIPSTEVRVRGGYSVTPSPYKNDPSSFDQTMFTGGAGIFLQRNVMLDAAFAYGSTKSFRNEYTVAGLPNTARVDKTVTTTLLNFTVSYRF
ncbi:MAG: outer membrane protein transport protein, partial [Bacteroidetes bacterium]|nr:outer membrane protein transport protein [Bacteroidota bacterium]